MAQCPFCRRSLDDDAGQCRQCGGIIRPGAVVADRYVVSRALGSGGMGIAYRCYDRQRREDIALNVLRKDLPPEIAEQISRRFHREGILASRVSQKNVCRIHDYGEAGDLQYISMELLEGDTLRQLVRAEGPLATDRVRATGWGWLLLEKPGATETEKHSGISWRNPGFIQGDLHPVVQVSWDDASAFCAWFGGRLPSEAEWEYAARGGAETIYVWGNQLMPVVKDQRQANVSDESEKRKFAHSDFSAERAFPGYDDGYPTTAPAGSFAANGFGLFDMAGNVWEWCADWFGERYYATSPASDPTGPAASDSRVLRGGSWLVGSSVLTVSTRIKGRPEAGDFYTGFRCARDAPP
jgi:hypothetical protein